MGRIGVSYLDIEKAASELQGKGISPTVDTIRELLGTGSRSTIGPYLKQWRSKQEKTEGLLDLPPELAAMVRGLYDRLQKAAALKIEEVEQQKQQAIAEIQQKYEQISMQNTALENGLKTTSLRLTETLALAEKFKLELDEKKDLNVNQTIRLQEYEIRLNDRLTQIHLLEKHLGNVQANLEHYREATLAQREEEKKAHEREQYLLNQEIVNLKNQIASIDQTCLKLDQKLNEAALEKQTLEKEWYEQRSKTMLLQEQLKLKEFMCKEIEEKHIQLSKDHKNLEEAYKKKTHDVELIKEDGLVLQEKLNSTKHLLNKSENTVHDLQRERLFLIQENASLKTELKRMIGRKKQEKILQCSKPV